MNHMNVSKPSKQNGKISWPGASSFNQMFSLPDSIIYYITKNPSTSKVYLQLVQSCKYFFEKHPLLVLARIHDDDGTKFCLNGQDECEDKSNKCCIKLNITKITTKIWLTDEFDFFSTDDAPRFSPLLISKIYRCEEANVFFSFNKISLKNFQLLGSKFQKYNFCNSSVTDSDGNNVTLEKVLGSISNVKEFKYDFRFCASAVTASTMKNICKFQHFGSLRYFCLENIPGIINVGDILAFIKRQKDTKILLTFCKYVSDGYKNQLDKLSNIIIGSKFTNCCINYRGQDKEKYQIMHARFRR